MFSETEYTYIKNLVITHVLKGEYNYYVCYTETDISGNYNTDTDDVHCIFTKEKITSSNNTFRIQNGLKVSIDSNQASRNANNGRRFAFTESNGTVSVPIYEFIYSNAESTKYADLIAQEEINIGNHLDLNEFYMIPMFMALLIMMLFLKWCFPMKGGKNV